MPKRGLAETTVRVYTSYYWAQKYIEEGTLRGFDFISKLYGMWQGKKVGKWNEKGLDKVGMNIKSRQPHKKKGNPGKLKTKSEQVTILSARIVQSCLRSVRDEFHQTSWEGEVFFLLVQFCFSTKYKRALLMAAILPYTNYGAMQNVKTSYVRRKRNGFDNESLY